MITFIWAEDKKHQIGLNGHLPWHLPQDMQHFKKLTKGHPIVMGRKTFDSLPKILPQRQHLVLSRNPNLARKYAENEQVTVFSSLSDLNRWLKTHQNDSIFVIGGFSIFQALKEQVNCLEKTEIKATFAGDTKMPPIDYARFKLISEVTYYPSKHTKYLYRYLTYVRKEK